MGRGGFWSVVLALLVVLGGFAGAEEGVGITDEMLLNAQDLEDQWVHYSRAYNGWRYTPTDQINRDTVRRLVPKTVVQTGITDGAFETTAIYEDGRLYITTPSSQLWCVDARTGHTIWKYVQTLPWDLKLCCGPVNRGVAIRGNTVFWGTLDAHLIAFDKNDGTMLWDRIVADYRDSYSLTSAPLIIKDMVLIGPGGAEFGVRGFIDAYHVDTGERIWRRWLTPAPGEPGNETWEGDSWRRGGATAWLPGTYDPELDRIYWAVGNPSPDWDGSVREGDNLYSESILALEPATGEILWYFQNTPHDVFDWAGVNEPILIDETINGRPVKALVQANRNGYLYALDRVSGEFLYAKPFTETNWAVLDDLGRPRIRPEIYTQDTNRVCPGVFGGSNWPPCSYSPDTHLVYIPEMKRCATYIRMPVEYRRGLPYYGGIVMLDDIIDPADEPSGSLKAFDTRTGEEVWSFDMGGPNWAGALSTGGGLVFAGAPDGYLRAFNDESGEVLWKFQTGSGLYAPPTSFVMDGKQYIGIASGWGQPAEVVGLKVDSKGSAYFLFSLFDED